MAKFHFTETPLKGLYIIEPTVYGDGRGYFMETFNAEFAPYLRHLDGSPAAFVQDNESFSRRGVLRGLHFQIRQPQGKLVRVIRGEVFDVAVDLRKNGATFGKWYGITLSGENKRQFYIPEGFAHGFLVLSEEAVFVYKCTRPYNSDDEAGLIWNDERVGIRWPAGDFVPSLSDRDRMNPCFDDLVKKGVFF